MGVQFVYLLPENSRQFLRAGHRETAAMLDFLPWDYLRAAVRIKKMEKGGKDLEEVHEPQPLTLRAPTLPPSHISGFPGNVTWNNLCISFSYQFKTLVRWHSSCSSEKRCCNDSQGEGNILRLMMKQSRDFSWKPYFASLILSLTWVAMSLIC